jgi:hypothetical protein
MDRPRAIGIVPARFARVPAIHARPVRHGHHH